MVGEWILMTWLFLGGDAPRRLETLGRFEERVLPEVSGIVKSRRHPGIYWVHNDSGNPPLLFAIRRDGSIVRSFRLAIPNIDWEDIAADDRGHIYLADIGNNGGLLGVRTIYMLAEPDPEKPPAEPIRPLASSFYAMPKANRFDAEGIYLEGCQAVLITKRGDGRAAELFAVPLDPPAALLRPSAPRKIGILPGFVDPATGASLSDDGRQLAVCSTGGVRVYRKANSAEWELIAAAAFDRDSVEGIAWEGQDLLLVSERGGVDRLAESVWKAAAPRPSETAPASRQKRDSR